MRVLSAEDLEEITGKLIREFGDGS
jgi:hypothetical protein